MGFHVRYNDSFKIQNVVASADVHFPIHLENLEVHNQKNPNPLCEIQFMP